MIIIVKTVTTSHPMKVYIHNLFNWHLFPRLYRRGAPCLIDLNENEAEGHRQAVVGCMVY